METEDKKFGKNVDKCLSFVSAVEDYASWYKDLNGRNGYIVGNGRVHEWLDSSDVEKACTRLELTPRQIVAVNEEFDDSRLGSIWEHCCEIESEYYREWLEGCAFNDYYKRQLLYGSYLKYQEEDCESCWLERSWERRINRTESKSMVGSDIKYYLKEFADYHAQGFTQKQVWEKYQKENADSIKGLHYLNILNNDAKNTWGGKYPSIASESTVAVHENSDIEDLVYWIENADREETTNKAFFDNVMNRNPEGYYNYSRFDSVKDLMNQIDSYLEDMEDMQSAVEYVTEYIDAVVKNFKETLVDQLEHEIGNFISDEYSIEERVQEGLAKINHVEVGTDIIVTDLKASVPIIDAKHIIELHNQGTSVSGMMVGAYKINKVFTIDDETYFKIGCHLLKLSEVSQKLAI